MRTIEEMMEARKVKKIPSIDYSKILDMEEREALGMKGDVRGWGPTMGSISDVYRELYIEKYYGGNNIYTSGRDFNFVLDPPPLYIWCIMKLKKLGLNSQHARIFSDSYPDAANALKRMEGVKITYWTTMKPYFGGYNHYIHVNDRGERTDYSIPETYYN